VKISFSPCKLSHNSKATLRPLQQIHEHHMHLSITIMDPSSHASILNKGKRGKKNKQSEWKCHASLSAHDQKHGCHNIKNVPILGQCKHHHSLVHNYQMNNLFYFNNFSIGLDAHLRRWQRKENVKRRMWIVLQPNWHESTHLVDRGKIPLSYLNHYKVAHIIVHWECTQVINEIIFQLIMQPHVFIC